MDEKADTEDDVTSPVVIGVAAHKDPVGSWERWMLMSDGTLRKKICHSYRGDSIVYVDTRNFTFSYEPFPPEANLPKYVRMAQYANDLLLWDSQGNVIGVRYNPLFYNYERRIVNMEKLAMSNLREG